MKVSFRWPVFTLHPETPADVSLLYQMERAFRGKFATLQVEESSAGDIYGTTYDSRGKLRFNFEDPTSSGEEETDA